PPPAGQPASTALGLRCRLARKTPGVRRPEEPAPFLELLPAPVAGILREPGPQEKSLQKEQLCRCGESRPAFEKGFPTSRRKPDRAGHSPRREDESLPVSPDRTATAYRLPPKMLPVPAQRDLEPKPELRAR